MDFNRQNTKNTRYTANRRRTSVGCEVAFPPDRHNEAPSMPSHTHAMQKPRGRDLANRSSFSEGSYSINETPQRTHEDSPVTVSPTPFPKRRCSIQSGYDKYKYTAATVDVGMAPKKGWQDTSPSTLYPTKFPSCREIDRLSASLNGKQQVDVGDPSRRQAPKPHHEQPEIEISPGVSVRLRGRDETMLAVYRDEFVPLDCLSCGQMIFCMQNARLVVCPICRVVSPLMNPDEDNEGVGLGFTLEDLCEWHEQHSVLTDDA